AAVGITKTAVAYHFHPKDRLVEELITPAADDLIALLETDYPGPQAFLRAFIEFAVRHRTVIRLLTEDIGGADDAPPGSPREAIKAFSEQIFTKLTGTTPSAEERIRACAALGAVQVSVVKTLDLPEETVAETLTDIVLALYGGSRSEERRVGKECKTGGIPNKYMKTETNKVVRYT